MGFRLRFSMALALASASPHTCVQGSCHCPSSSKQTAISVLGPSLAWEFLHFALPYPHPHHHSSHRLGLAPCSPYGAGMNRCQAVPPSLHPLAHHPAAETFIMDKNNAKEICNFHTSGHTASLCKDVHIGMHHFFRSRPSCLQVPAMAPLAVWAAMMQLKMERSTKTDPF